MNNFLEDLKKYFEVTPREKFLEDWAKTEEFDQMGPTMDSFLVQTNWYYNIQLEDPIVGCKVTNNEYSPKFSSGFFLFKK